MKTKKAKGSKRWLRGLLIALAIILALLAAAWFLPMPAGGWGQQEPSAGYVGAFERNDALAELSYLELGTYKRPETVIIHNEYVYASVEGGTLLRMRPDGSELTPLLQTGGCLLGFDFTAEGDVIAVDCAYDGTGALLQIAEGGAGACTVLAGRETGFALYYPNAVAIASSGVIYFTDSSRAFPPAAYGNSSSVAAGNEALMHTCTGRLLAYDPQTQSVRVLAEGLAFSNGLALSADETSLFLCETYAYAVARFDLQTGTMEPFLENLPGFPDNLTKGADGRYWVGLNGERSASLDAISHRPFLRKLVWLYGKLSPAAEGAGGYCHVFAFTEDGQVTESLQSGDNGYVRSTGATETADRLYVQSINDTGRLAYIERGTE